MEDYKNENSRICNCRNRIFWSRTWKNHERNKKELKSYAVLDPENGQTIADELGCDVETDLDTLYSRDDVDAVIVATPNYLHKEPVVKAAEHGVNVFCEKPIALSYQDCDDMVRACQESWSDFYGRTCYELFPWRKTCEEID